MMLYCFDFLYKLLDPTSLNVPPYLPHDLFCSQQVGITYFSAGVGNVGKLV